MRSPWVVACLTVAAMLMAVDFSFAQPGRGGGGPRIGGGGAPPSGGPSAPGGRPSIGQGSPGGQRGPSVSPPQSTPRSGLGVPGSQGGSSGLPTPPAGGTRPQPGSQPSLGERVNPGQSPAIGERPAAGERTMPDNRTVPNERPTRGDVEGFLGRPENPGERRVERPVDPNHPSDLSSRVRNDWSETFADLDQPFTASWYNDHPNAWKYSHPHADAYAAASWGAVTGWVAGVSTTAYPYDYGTTVVYADDGVYYNGELTGTTEQYYTQAQQLASAGGTAQQVSQQTANTDQWMTLGAYALLAPGQTEPVTYIQLAVSKQGQLRGTYYDVLSNREQPVAGSVSTTSQRAAFRVADNESVTLETGLANLTSDQSTLLVHLGEDRRQNWTMVRLPDQSNGG